MTLPQSLQDRRTLITVSLLLFLVLTGLITLLNIRRRQELRRSAAPPGTIDAQIQLTSSPSDLSNLQAGSTFDISVGVHSAQNDIYGLDLVSSAFDPAVIQVQDILLGSGVDDGCQPSGSGVPVVFAPINSETDCNFKKSQVISTANSTGVLDFGIAAFDWSASDSPDYTPSPLPKGSTYHQVAIIRFEAKSSGSTTFQFRADNFTGQATTDTNAAAIFDDQSVGDVLSSIQPASFNISVSGTAPTATPVPAGCDSKVPQVDPNGDGNLEFMEVMLYIANYQCNFSGGDQPCNSQIPSTADGVLDGNPNGTIDFMEVMYVIANYNCGNL
jgi:hypothetical protein